jgi:hypothetical protein
VRILALTILACVLTMPLAQVHAGETIGVIVSVDAEARR